MIAYRASLVLFSCDDIFFIITQNFSRPADSSGLVATNNRSDRKSVFDFDEDFDDDVAYKSHANQHGDSNSRLKPAVLLPC
jgi:hypothetical protein